MKYIFIMLVIFQNIAFANKCLPLVHVDESFDDVQSWETEILWPKKAVEAQKARAASGQPEDLHRYAMMLMVRDKALARKIQSKAVEKQPELQLFNWYRMFENATEAGETTLLKASLLGDIRAQRVLAVRLLPKLDLKADEFWQLYAWRESVGVYHMCLKALNSGDKNIKLVCQEMVRNSTEQIIANNDLALRSLLCHLGIKVPELK